MDLDRALLRTAPLAGLGALSWVAYRLMTARLFRFLDLVAIATLVIVLYEMHRLCNALLRHLDQGGGDGGGDA